MQRTVSTQGVRCVGNMMLSVVLDGNPLNEDDDNLFDEVVLDEICLDELMNDVNMMYLQ